MIHNSVFERGFRTPTIKRKMRRVDHPKAESVRRDERTTSDMRVSRREGVGVGYSHRSMPSFQNAADYGFCLRIPEPLIVSVKQEI